MINKLYFLIKNKRKKSKIITLTFTDYQMDLIIKCLSKGCRNNDIDKYLFRNLEKDKACIYYLQRILACKCNERFYNIKNNDYFILDRKSY